MGVYIKGMEMPTSCDDCRLNNGISCYAVPEYTEDGVVGRTDDRPDWCPLVYVPPHGRLIDADAFLALINDSTILSDFLKCIINPLIRGEPTVIEAEEGET